MTGLCFLSNTALQVPFSLVDNFDLIYIDNLCLTQLVGSFCLGRVAQNIYKILWKASRFSDISIVGHLQQKVLKYDVLNSEFITATNQ